MVKAGEFVLIHMTIIISIISRRMYSPSSWLLTDSPSFRLLNGPEINYCQRLIFVQNSGLALKVLPADRSHSPISTGPLFILIAWASKE